MLPDLFCFSHLRWDFVWQRPQHLMTRAAESRHVWFIEEPQSTQGAGYVEIKTAAPNIFVVVPLLPAGLDRAQAGREQGHLLSQLPLRHAALPPVHWYYTPMAREFSHVLPAGTIVYDCMDELSAFAGAPPEMLAWESELLTAADLVFTGGASLYEAKRDRHPKVFAFPSSVDVAHFRAARTPLPDSDAQSALPRPRIGFAGVVDERLDRDLLGEVARLRPGYTFVVLGPIAKISAETLPRPGNIHYLGMQPYAELPRFMAHWDAAILPFARNDATRWISPTKTPEYLSAGCPVVSTSIPDVVRPYGERGMVRIADEPEAFAAALDQALASPPPGWLESVDAHLATLSWDRTWAEMHGHLLEAEATRGSVPRASGARVGTSADPAASGI
jgi:glycosyltransferase involved in cell wall biosynthesis